MSGTLQAASLISAGNPRTLRRRTFATRLDALPLAMPSRKCVLVFSLIKEEIEAAVLEP
jgi:hypothetical protein